MLFNITNFWTLLALLTTALTNGLVLADHSCKGGFKFRSTAEGYPLYAMGPATLQPLNGCGVSGTVTLMTYYNDCRVQKRNGLVVCANWDGKYTVTVKDSCPCLKGDASVKNIERGYTIYDQGY